MHLIDLPDQPIPLPDGTRLSARLWRPASGPPVPAILEFIPYRKSDGTRVRDETIHPFWAAQGYACLRVDLRGSGDSGGLLADEYTEQELQDACAVIAWAAAQPWCSGRVGMMGKSWGAFNALQTAALRPPALAAVIAVCGTVDRFADDIHFKGGALMGENLGWAATMLSYQSRPPDPALRLDWRAEWRQRLEHLPFLAPLWAGHQSRDGYWRHGSVCEHWAAIGVPVLGLGGWADGYMNMALALVEHLPRAQAVIGPWVHQYPHTAVPGPRIGFLQMGLRWWDRWLKDAPNGAEHDRPVRLYLQDAAPPDPCAAARPGRWIAEPAWPSSRIAFRTIPLTPQGLGGAPGPLDRLLDSPQHLGMAGGEYFPTGLNGELPDDQREDDALSACFETGPLAEPCDLLGRPVLRLTLTSAGPRAHLVARLCAVAPDGASSRISHGVLNLCHRDDPGAPRDVPVGGPFEASLTLDTCAVRLPAGHRLRLALSTTCWPLVWPTARPAGLRLVAGELTLPELTAAGDWSPPPPLVPDPAPVEALTPPKAARRVEHDLIAGTRTLVIEDDTGRQRLATGLTVGESFTERWQIHPRDPLSARAAIRWHQHLSREGWSVEVDTACTMTASETDLHLTATLTARENGAEVLRRVWSEKVPRRWA